MSCFAQEWDNMACIQLPILYFCLNGAPSIFVQTQLCSCSGSLASSLEINRKGKQLTKASCGTCRRRPIVDGIEPESASMLSTVDLELTNFINSDLTWKKVKKGCRSTNRRSRKSVIGSLNVGVELRNKSRKRNQDSSVIESEKVCFLADIFS